MVKRVTIRDIAEHLGISKTTVSVALLDKYGVNESTKSKIVVTAIEMGYNFESLKNYSRAKKILVLLFDRKFLSTSFWSEIMEGIEQECSRRRHAIEILALDPDYNKEDLQRSIIASKPKGIIVLGDVSSQQNSDLSPLLQVPHVSLDPYNYLGSGTSQVSVDNFTGGEKAGKYFIKMGHKKLCFVGNISHSRSFLIRCQGFESAVLEREDKETICHKIHMQDTIDKNNFYAGEKLIELMSQEDRPTALFCANDSIALSVMIQLKERLSLECAKDYSIIGFDNIKESLSSSPRLTTIGTNRKVFGSTGINVLFNEIENPTRIKSNVMVFTQLIERNSVVDLNNQG